MNALKIILLTSSTFAICVIPDDAVGLVEYDQSTKDLDVIELTFLKLSNLTEMAFLLVICFGISFAIFEKSTDC